MPPYEMFQPEHLSNPKVIALQTALRDRDPFYSGRCTIPDFQRTIFYADGDISRRIDFSNVGTDDLETLYCACKPADFGRNEENVLDKSYRKARKLELGSFSAQFDPRSLGIYDQVSKALLTQCYQTMDAQLYELNAHGQGDFFKVHKDTPRGEDMFGSLVIILPTAHEGGQIILRRNEEQWMLDFADKFVTAEPSVCFVAFYGDLEHEVLPVTSGYRVTLTYNLYHKPTQPSALSIITPSHLNLRRALINLVNDKTILPNGGYLGFGLVHEYVHTGRNLVEPLLGQLKGSDRALADVCDELGLRYSLRLFYPDISEWKLNLMTTKELGLKGFSGYYFSWRYLEEALQELTIEQAECVTLVGGQHPFDPQALEDSDNYGYYTWLKGFYRTPVTEVMEITQMKSSVDSKTSFQVYSLQSASRTECFYGTASMLIAVQPAASRPVPDSTLSKVHAQINSESDSITHGKDHWELYPWYFGMTVLVTLVICSL